jgi:hypothetical protein
MQKSLGKVVDRGRLESHIRGIPVSPDTGIGPLTLGPDEVGKEVAKPDIAGVRMLPRLRCAAMEPVDDEDARLWSVSALNNVNASSIAP